MELLYKAMIPLNPIPKKNSPEIHQIKKRIGNRLVTQRFVAPSERFVYYQNQSMYYLNLSKKPAEPIAVPVEVRCLFYRDSRRRVDLTNLEEAIDDILVHAKILKDDDCKILVSHDGSRVILGSKEPRTEIEIYSL